MNAPPPPDISVVIPVYNEEEGLPFLFERLYPALDALGRSYEVVFVDDGSRDRSVAELREQFQRRPDVTRVVVLARNAGQHLAILAAFQQSRGRYVITLDADLQNPPEEITRLVAAMDAGADYVGTIRVSRQDVLWRKAASRFLNRVREGTTSIHITDQGCMLRGYDRSVIDEHHLVGAAERIERGVQPLEEERQPLLLVVHRDHDRDIRRRLCVHRRAPRTMSLTAATTRSTSASCMAGKSGSVTVSRPMRSAFGNCPARLPSAR